MAREDLLATAILLRHLVPALDKARADLEELAGAERPATSTQLLEAEDVARILKCSQSQVSRLCSDKTPEQKRLPHVRLGERLMFVESVLLDCLAERARQSLVNPLGGGGEQEAREAS